MQIPVAERARRWRAYAAADRAAAERLAPDLWHVACFHAQQASENGLKAVLTLLHGDVVPTHLAQVLLRGIADLGEAIPDDVAAAANSLDRYYVPTRYPDALDFADAAVVYRVEDALQAIAWADTVLRWCDSRLAEMRGTV